MVFEQVVQLNELLRQLVPRIEVDQRGAGLVRLAHAHRAVQVHRQHRQALGNQLIEDLLRQALYGLLAEIEELKEDHNEGLEVEGIVVNQFQARASLPQQILDELIAEGLPVLPVYLNSSVRMRESHQASTPLIHLDPRHKLTQQFVELHNLLEDH